MVYQPHFLRERRYLDGTPNVNLLSLPHKIRSLIYAYFFNGKTFSNKGRDKFLSEMWHARDENGMMNQFPQGLNIPLVCRRLDTEATYALHHERSCTFCLEVNAAKICNAYHTPFPSHMTLKRVLRLLFFIRLDAYGALHPAQKEAWRLYLENSSLEARCMMLLKSERPVEMHFLEGLSRLLRILGRCKHVEILVLPDMRSCKDGSIYGSFGRGNASVLKVCGWI
ncbi:hypothetical protein N7G274_002525 [Stereocaulon virgatum]|uniref:Maturase K n=1 Tax=Stereocaulon virgatum TaxID=373712 RepID=A0ABR4AG71_9LECA